MKILCATLLALTLATPAWARNSTECQLTHNCPGGFTPDAEGAAVPEAVDTAGGRAPADLDQVPLAKCTRDSEYGGVTCE